MLDLSPTKLLIIFIVAVVLLGPKRLPQVARQLGSGWRRLRELHERVDREVRQSVPDLPSSSEIVRFARSPVTLLNQLAEMGPGAEAAGVAGPVTGVGARPLASEDDGSAVGGSPRLGGPAVLDGSRAAGLRRAGPPSADCHAPGGADAADAWGTAGAWGTGAKTWGFDDPGMN